MPAPPIVASGFGDFLNYLPVGLGYGGGYALAALGLVLIYRVSGVLNFAQGGVATFAAFVAYTITNQLGWLPEIGLVAAILVGCVLGLLIEGLTIRPLTGRPPLVKVAVTIGWLLVLQQASGLIWGFTAYHDGIHLVSRDATFPVPGTSVHFGFDSLVALVVGLALAAGTATLLRYTTLGTSMRAVADDPQGARLWGINVDRVTALSWMLGSAMAAVAGVLISPNITFTPYSLTLVVVASFGAALIGRLQSLTFTVVGAMVLGIAQQLPAVIGANGSPTQEAVTFVVILLALAILFRLGVQAMRRV